MGHCARSVLDVINKQTGRGNGRKAPARRRRKLQLSARSTCPLRGTKKKRTNKCWMGQKGKQFFQQTIAIRARNRLISQCVAVIGVIGQRWPASNASGGRLMKHSAYITCLKLNHSCSYNLPTKSISWLMFESDHALRNVFYIRQFRFSIIY